MRTSFLAGPLAFLLSAAAADAGQVLKYAEEGTRKGKAYRSTVTLSAAAEGIRVEVADVEDSGPPRTVVFLYSAKDDTIFPVEPPTAPVISAATIDVVAGRARASGHRRRPGVLSVTPLHTTHTVAGFTCAAWALRRPGQTTEIVYLADPAAVGVDATTRANLRRMGALFVPFVNAMRLAEGDLREGFNNHALEQGFPVREFRAKDGVVEVDSQLVSVTNADFPPELLRVPDRPEVSAAPAGASRAPDHSLSTAAWIERGMPAPDRTWVMTDYDRAVEVLTPVAREDVTHLPRRGSAASGEVFGRFVDPGNLALARTSSMDANLRLRMGAGVMVGVGKLTLLYAGASRDGKVFDEEIADLIVFTLLVSREVVPLADDVVARLPRNAPDRAARLQGRDKMRAGLGTIVSGCLDGLGAADGFRPAERLRLARALEEHLPTLRPHLPPGARQELPVRLRKMSAAEKDPAVKDVLERVRAALPRPRAKTA